ncbi:hypothetical protein HaLaN_14957 [Haematococcus lacustris]|uniref:Uncharacterized protein n=1 Tax=Haematococcus lacustris TaxID=44745 RepID=A0A699Z6E7_HAELA|nr:hypothetical protein HaLaN_14957 [Haematococcus lacustris]
MLTPQGPSALSMNSVVTLASGQGQLQLTTRIATNASGGVLCCQRGVLGWRRGGAVSMTVIKVLELRPRAFRQGVDGRDAAGGAHRRRVAGPPGAGITPPWVKALAGASPPCCVPAIATPGAAATSIPSSTWSSKRGKGRAAPGDWQAPCQGSFQVPSTPFQPDLRASGPYPQTPAPTCASTVIIPRPCAWRHCPWEPGAGEAADLVQEGPSLALRHHAARLTLALPHISTHTAHTCPEQPVEQPKSCALQWLYRPRRFTPQSHHSLSSRAGRRGRLTGFCLHSAQHQQGRKVTAAARGSPCHQAGRAEGVREGRGSQGGQRESGRAEGVRVGRGSQGGQVRGCGVAEGRDCPPLAALLSTDHAVASRECLRSLAAWQLTGQGSCRPAQACLQAPPHGAMQVREKTVSWQLTGTMCQSDVNADENISRCLPLAVGSHPNTALTLGEACALGLHVHQC